MSRKYAERLWNIHAGKEKIWENMNISKLRVFGIFCSKQKSMQFTWEKWISIIREKYGKTQTFQIYGFLKVLDEAEIHEIPKTWEK